MFYTYTVELHGLLTAVRELRVIWDSISFQDGVLSSGENATQ